MKKESTRKFYVLCECQSETCQNNDTHNKYLCINRAQFLLNIGRGASKIKCCEDCASVIKLDFKVFGVSVEKIVRDYVNF